MDPLTRSRGWLPAGEGESDWLLHLDGDRFLFLVDVGGLGKLDVAGSDVAGGRKLDALFRAGDHHALPELTQILKKNNFLLLFKG